MQVDVLAGLSDGDVIIRAEDGVRLVKSGGAYDVECWDWHYDEWTRITTLFKLREARESYEYNLGLLRGDFVAQGLVMERITRRTEVISPERRAEE